MMFHMNNDLFLTKTGGMFVTCILGEYNTRSDEIRWVNGGHQPAFLRSSSGIMNNMKVSLHQWE